jgi:hypothetical protein
MDNIQQIIQVVQNGILRKLGGEVDLIFQYGSYLKGTTHKYSDVDISYVPIHETTWDCITVMVGETMCDLYPMHWSQLERMADFRDLSSTVLLNNQIIHQRTEAVAERFRALSAQLQALQQPEMQSEMIQRALEIFQSTAYAHYLLRQQAASGHRLGCLQQAQTILRTVFHCLAVCNQACIDTRKIEQVLALPKLPVGFAETARCIIISYEPDELLSACEALLRTTRELLLVEQRRSLRHETTFPVTFNAAYPELKRDLQGVLLACERQDMFSLKGSLVSLYHEMSRGIAQVFTGIEYSDFNSLAEYEQDLVALGFPALMPYWITGDFDGLYRQCLVFDKHLQKFFTERSVELNTFATLDELQKYLTVNNPT